jgi:hypothetical protein
LGLRLGKCGSSTISFGTWVGITPHIVSSELETEVSVQIDSTSKWGASGVHIPVFPQVFHQLEHLVEVSWIMVGVQLLSLCVSP